MRFEISIFWVVTPCGLVVDTNVSEKHTASIFRAEVTTQKTNSFIENKKSHSRFQVTGSYAEKSKFTSVSSL
jgi:hypothetical protein